MQLDDKVLLGRLYERTSQKGNRYFSGRLGAARVMLFKDDYADDDNVWQLFVQEGGEKSPQVAQQRQGSTNMTPRCPEAVEGHQRVRKRRQGPKAIFR